MLGNGTNALNLAGVLHVECLDTAIVKDVPELDHTL